MSETEKKPEAVAITDDIGQDAKGLGTMPKAEDKSPEVDIARLTDKWKRALADAENTRKRADASYAATHSRSIPMLSCTTSCVSASPCSSHRLP